MKPETHHQGLEGVLDDRQRAWMSTERYKRGMRGVGESIMAVRWMKGVWMTSTGE